MQWTWTKTGPDEFVSENGQYLVRKERFIRRNCRPVKPPMRLEFAPGVFASMESDNWGRNAWGVYYRDGTCLILARTRQAAFDFAAAVEKHAQEKERENALPDAEE